MISVDIGIFAHNEGARIEAIVKAIARQTILTDERISARILVLANGCRDDTVERARSMAAVCLDGTSILVEDLSLGGKSRTWNDYVHRIARQDATYLIFCDADIELPDPDGLSRLVNFIVERSDVNAASSLPVKDLDHYPQRLTLVEKAIVAGGGTLGDTCHAICGQLYVMRGEVARALRIPIGLPVEDGFVRHALITDNFTAPFRYGAIDRPDGVFHVYASERSIGSLVRHQVRIVIGGAINAALFRHLIRVGETSGQDVIAENLDRSSRDDQWLAAQLGSALPRWRFGWVPWPFLNSRIKAHIKDRRFTARGTLMALVGFGFDALVYVLAQAKMARGQGVGYW